MMQASVPVGPGISHGRDVPQACIVGQIFVQTDGPMSERFDYYCTSTNTWRRAADVTTTTISTSVPQTHAPMTEQQGWLVISMLAVIILLLVTSCRKEPKHDRDC